MDHSVTEMTIAVMASVFASSGFWMFLQAYTQRKSTKQSAHDRMLLGLGHDRIVYLCLKYIKAKGLTQDEFENLHDYLYKPYLELGGNGSAKNLMEKVYMLPIIPDAHEPVKSRRKIMISKEEIK